MNWNTWDGIITQFDVATGNVLAKHRVNRSKVIQAKLADDAGNSVLFSTDSDDSIWRIDLASGMEMIEFDGDRFLPDDPSVNRKQYGKYIHDFIAVDDGIFLAVGYAICRFDRASQTLAWVQIPGGSSLVDRTDRTIAFQSHSRIVFMQGESRMILHETSAELFVLLGESAPIFFEYDEQRVGREATVTVRRIHGLQAGQFQIGHDEMIGIACSSDGSVLATIHNDGTLQIFRCRIQ